MAMMTTRRALDAAEPTRHALLGLLLEGPRHGYDLARCFHPGTALGSVVHLSASHLYALLARLERDGLIAGAMQEAGARPARRVFHLTAAGREAAWRWLDEPVARPRDMLLDFPIKLYLIRRHAPERAAALIERQRRLFADYLTYLERAAPRGTDDAFIALMQEGRIARTRAALTWLDQCAAFAEAPTGVRTEE